MYGKRSSIDDYEARMPLNNTYGKLQRINLWFTVAGRAKIENMIDEYFNALENVYSDVYPHLTKEETEEIQADILKIENFLDTTNFSGDQYEQVRRNNRRKGSNLCDSLRLKLSAHCKKYKLEWLDVEEWARNKKENEPIVRG